LQLNDNQLSGTLPPELGLLTRLELIYLDNNQFSGALPAEFGRLTGLHSLCVEHNQLTGTIPAELGQCTNLSRFFLITTNFLERCRWNSESSTGSTTLPSEATPC
jgi:Leucine-rich repeat (LRR) protein